MDIFVGVIVGLIVLMVLVVAHEFGHFLAARRNGVRVLEFGIGFPPKAMAWKYNAKQRKWIRIPRSEWNKNSITKTVGVTKNEQATSSDTSKDNHKLIEDGLIFSINWLPIGGFCQMDGESAEDTRKGTFGHASFLAKTKILFAGVAMNWLVAIIILTILAWTGMPQFLENQFTIDADTRTRLAPVEVVSVLEGSPAEKAGFQAGDKIIAVNGGTVEWSSQIKEYNSAHAGEEVSYLVSDSCEELYTCDKENSVRELKVKLNPEDSEYLLGVSMESSQSLSYSTWSAPLVGIGLSAQMTGETYKGLGEMLWNLISGVGAQFSFDGEVRESGRESISTVGDSVSGPVGIVGVLFPSFTAAGPTNLAFLAALISISLACMNVLPIPALDGGRWLLIAIYKLRHKKLTKATEEKIVARAFMILLALLAVVTILDISRFFR